MPSDIEQYFKNLEKELKKCYQTAEEARKKGYDPVEYVEIPLAANMAERVEGLISALAPQIKGSGVVQRIHELEKQYGALDWRVALTVALEVAQQKFCRFKDEREAMEAGIRVGFAYATVGVVASPLEGFVELKIRQRRDGKKYFALMYSGPVRSAGGTGASVSVLIADYIRKKMGYEEYDITEEEINRNITEVYDYHERVTNLQYYPSKEELTFLLKNLPVQIDGDPSEKYEVSNYKDLKRIETNTIRNGPCLVLAECLSQKAKKVNTQLKKWGKDFDLDQWNFLDEFLEIQKKSKAKGEEGTHEKIKPDYTYINDLVGGRPVLTHPLRRGGFRLRYGRCRNSGFSSDAIHPASMAVMDDFVAIGTQLKMERPKKATAISVCDQIEGPVVKLKNGSVMMLDTEEKARKHLKEVEEIIFLGDILVNYGDFFNRAHRLVPCGYNEDWYKKELEKAGIKKEVNNVEEAIKIAKQNKVPLHPKYTYHWGEINKKQLLSLLNWIKQGNTEKDKIILPYVYDVTSDVEGVDPKRTLELLGVPHTVTAKECVTIKDDDATALLTTLGLDEFNHVDEITQKINSTDTENVLEIVNAISGIIIRDKSGTFIGARMGRPEKAKMRELDGSPQVLFPVGQEGGKMRNFRTALEKGKVTGDFPIMKCEKCNKITIYPVCEDCDSKTKKMYYCAKCRKEYETEECEEHGKNQTYKTQEIDIKHYFDQALKKVKTKNIPEVIKGVRGTSNKNHIPENLTKGILRAIHHVYVNKDGTIRYDMTELGLTAFKPKEIGTSIAKLKELGYEKDIHGKKLETEEQVLELKPQDVILPAFTEGPEEGADKVILRVSKFIDDMLVRLYGMKKFYNLKTEKDLVGHLVMGMSPHTSAGVIARIIGFSKTQGFIAHPLFHSLMRRDCLGYNNYVYLNQDGGWKIEKIGKIIDEINPTNKVDNFGTLAKKTPNTYTWSNPGQSQVKEATKHKPSEMLRIHLEDGRQIELTKGHIVYTKDKNEKKAYELKIGDKLTACYNICIEEKDMEEIFLPTIFSGRQEVMLRNIRDFLNKFEKLSKHENFTYRNSYPITFVEEFLKKHNKTLHDLPPETKIAIKRDNVFLPITIRLDKELLEIIGLYIAEGYLRKNNSKKGFYQLIICNEQFKNLVKKVFYNHFGLRPSYEDVDSAVFSSRILYELFNDYFMIGYNAKTKRIPSLFLNLKKEKMCALLRGYFEGDGSVSVTDTRVTCDTVSEGLKHDLSFVLSRFGILTKFYEYCKEPGPKVKEFYIKKNRPIPKFKITKIIITSPFVRKFSKIGFISDRKNKILTQLTKKNLGRTKIEFDENYAYPRIVKIEEIGMHENYCLNVPSEHNFFSNDLLVHNCDGDEACVILLLDALINFSRSYLPSHRGAVQDAPLVQSSRIIPTEVDDMVFDMDVVYEYPLELYEAAQEYKYPWEVQIEQLKQRLGTEKQYYDFGFTHDTTDINEGTRRSAYKNIPTMLEKIMKQIQLAEKIRAVDEADVARLVIEKHLLRDIRGNLRKFSMQEFRCVDCNTKYRRPPLTGRCKCGGRIIFTISQGSIVKYLEPSLYLAEKYSLPPYLRQTLELTKNRIESVFGKEADKQEGLGKWF